MLDSPAEDFHGEFSNDKDVTQENGEQETPGCRQLEVFGWNRLDQGAVASACVVTPADVLGVESGFLLVASEAVGRLELAAAEKAHGIGRGLRAFLPLPEFSPR